MGSEMCIRDSPDSVAASTELLQRLLARAESDPAGSTPTLRLARLTADLELRRRADGHADELPGAFREIQHELERVEQDIEGRYFGGEAEPQYAVR